MYPSSLGEILESSFNDTRESINTSPASLEDGDSSGSQFGVDLSGKTTNIAGKSFTIAAILGLGGASKDVMNLSVQERFGVQERFSGFQNRFSGQKHLEEYFFARRDVQQRIYRESYGANTERNQDNALNGNRLEQPTGNKPTKIGLQNLNHANTNSNRNKRIRTIFTPEQLERLEAEFERQQYMVGPERLYLAHALHLTEAQVKVWFQNRRIKWRKHHLELTQQRLAVLQRHRHDDNQEDID